MNKKQRETLSIMTDGQKQILARFGKREQLILIDFYSDYLEQVRREQIRFSALCFAVGVLFALIRPYVLDWVTPQFAPSGDIVEDSLQYALYFYGFIIVLFAPSLVYVVAERIIGDKLNKQLEESFKTYTAFVIGSMVSYLVIIAVEQALSDIG